MHAFQTLFAAFAFCFLAVTASPLSRRAVNAGDVHTGHVFIAHPQHFVPGHPTSSEPGVPHHPVVALGPSDHNGWVHVAPVSHNHPIHMGDNNHDASHYTQHTTKQFSEGSQIAVGGTRHVHVNNLTRVEPTAHMPHELHLQDAHNLKTAVHAHIAQHGHP